MSLSEFFNSSLHPFRAYLSYLNERNRYVSMRERFTLFASPIVTLPLLGTATLQVAQGFPHTIVLTHSYLQDAGSLFFPFTFNFQVMGSADWYFKNDLMSTVYYNGSYPVVFPRPIMLKHGSGLTIRITDLSNDLVNTNQFVFGGYKTGSKEVDA